MVQAAASSPTPRVPAGSAESPRRAPKGGGQ
jgi:hypothetical protein